MILANLKSLVPSRICGYLRVRRAVTRNNSLTRDLVEKFVQYPQWKGTASLSNQLPVKVAFVGEEYLGQMLAWEWQQVNVNPDDSHSVQKVTDLVEKCDFLLVAFGETNSDTESRWEVTGVVQNLITAFHAAGKPAAFWDASKNGMTDSTAEIAASCDFLFDASPSRAAANNATFLPWAAQSSLYNPQRLTQGFYLRPRKPVAHYCEGRGKIQAKKQPSYYRSVEVFTHPGPETDTDVCPPEIFELLACGTTVVTPSNSALNALFPAGAFPATTNTLDLEQRNRNAYCNAQYVMREHTYAQRARKLTATIGSADALPARPRITPLIATIRPGQMDHILDYLTAQQGVNICPIIGTHGFSAPETARQRAAALGIEVDWFEMNRSWSLGECYNRMLERTEAEYVAKMDDDDLYGPYYLSEAQYALQYSGAEMVGKHSRFLYLGDRDLTVLQFANKENRFSNFITGATIFTRTRTLRTLKFAEKRRGEDSNLLRRLLRQGGRIYSTSRFGFVVIREGSQDFVGHTHQADSTEFMKTSQEIHVGRPDEREIPKWEMTSWG